MLSKIGFGVERIKDFFAKTFTNEPQRVPNEIVIEATSRCNLDCCFCFNKVCIKKRGLAPDMSYDKIINIVDNISKSPVRKIRFTGGEPLMRKDIFKLIKHAHDCGLKVWLNTNATLIRKGRAELISKYVDNVLVSLNSSNRKDEKSVTGKDNFNKKLRGVKHLKMANLNKVRVGTVATKKNINNIESFYKLVEELGTDDWELFRPIPLKGTNLTNADVERLIEKLIFINKANNSRYLIRNALPICSYTPKKVDSVSAGADADDGHTRMVVDFRGFLKPAYYMCENVGDPKGDIMKAWNSNFMKKIRRLEYIPKICKGCRYIQKCKGGSRIVAKTIKGGYDEIDYLAQPEKYSESLF